MRGPKTNSSATGTSESSLPESPDDHHFAHLKTYERANFVYGGSAGFTHGQHGHHGHQIWNQNHHIYPAQQQYPLLQHHQLWPPQQPPQKVSFR